MIDINFLNQIPDRRKALGLTMAKAAEALGITPSMYNKREKNETFTVSELVKLCPTLNWDLEIRDLCSKQTQEGKQAVSKSDIMSKVDTAFVSNINTPSQSELSKSDIMSKVDTAFVSNINTPSQSELSKSDIMSKVDTSVAKIRTDKPVGIKAPYMPGWDKPEAVSREETTPKTIPSVKLPAKKVDPSAQASVEAWRKKKEAEAKNPGL